MAEDTWTSLEIAKLVVSALTPIVVTIIGVFVARATRRAEQARHDAAARDEQARREAAERAEQASREAARRADQAQWSNRRAIERLVELHKEMAPLMNDMFCFFSVVGHFRDITPPDLIARKRALDKLFYTNEHLFQPDFREDYRAYLDQCFEHWMSPGEDAKIRMSWRWLYQERGEGNWDEGWQWLFIDDPGVPASVDLSSAQKQAYTQAMDTFAAQLGLGADLRQATG